MEKDITSLFPDKDIISIIDLKFLDYLKTDKQGELITVQQLKTAVSEYLVIADKIKRINNLEEKLIEDVRIKAGNYYKLLYDKQSDIKEKVDKYFGINWDKISWAYHDAEYSQAVMEFENGKIIIESRQKINFKIKAKHL